MQGDAFRVAVRMQGDPYRSPCEDQMEGDPFRVAD
jgi:hypothetical protein